MGRRGWDIVVCVAIIAASGVVYWDSLKLKPGRYDPLGSGTMPRMVVAAIVVLCLVAIAQSLLASWASPAAASRAQGPEDGFVRRPFLALTIFGFLVAAAIMLKAGIPFGITSTLLLFASTLAIKRAERAIIVPAAALSALIGFGLTYLFGPVFGVDLP